MKPRLVEQFIGQGRAAPATASDGTRARCRRRNISWEQMFRCLETYRAQHGHCDVPFHEVYLQVRLGSWVAVQRQRYRRHELTSTKIRLLEGLGFSWSRHAAVWQEMSGRLAAFKARHGHCEVPPEAAGFPDLGQWVRMLRNQRREGRLAGARIRALDRMGFVWKLRRGVRWEKRYRELQGFQRKFGHCEVPTDCPAWPQLNAWLNDQRLFFREKKLSAAHLRRLEALGVSMNPLERRLEARLAELADFQARHGHTRVPARYGPNPKLGRWVHNQRHFFRRGKLAPAIAARLNALGFTWGRARAKRS